SSLSRKNPRARAASELVREPRPVWKLAALAPVSAREAPKRQEPQTAWRRLEPARGQQASPEARAVAGSKAAPPQRPAWSWDRCWDLRREAHTRGRAE